MQKSFTEFSLQQLSDLLDSREISSVELVQSLIEYIKKTEPAIGAFALLTPEHAQHWLFLSIFSLVLFLRSLL